MFPSEKIDNKMVCKFFNLDTGISIISLLNLIIAITWSLIINKMARQIMFSGKFQLTDLLSRHTCLLGL